MVRRKQHQGVRREVGADRREDLAQLVVAPGDRRRVPRAPRAGARGVDATGRQGQAGGIVLRSLLRPRHVGPVAADHQAEGLGAGAGPAAQEVDRRVDARVIVEHVVTVRVKAVLARLPVMGDFAERDDLVPEFLEVSRPLPETGFGPGVVSLGAIAGRHPPGEQGGAARGATRRGDVRAGEGEPAVREGLQVGRADPPAPIGRDISLTLVIREEHHQVRPRGHGGGRPDGPEDEEQQQERAGPSRCPS